MPGRTDPTDWLDELYSSGPAEEPPADLDDTIRRAAAAAVAGPRGQNAGRPWYRRPARLAGLAMAATVALAVGVLLVSRTPGVDGTLAARPDTEPDKAEAAPAREAAVPAPAAPAEEVDAAQPGATAGQVAETQAHGMADRQSDAAAEPPPPPQPQPPPQARAQRKSLPVGAANAALERAPVAARSARLSQAAPEPAGAAAGTSAPAGDEPALTLEDLTPPEQSPFSSLVPGAEDCDKSEFFDSGDSNPYALCTHEDGSRDLRHADCGSPYPIPDGAVVEASDDAVVVTHGDAVTTVSCHDGGWVTSHDEPDP